MGLLIVLTYTEYKFLRRLLRLAEQDSYSLIGALDSLEGAKDLHLKMRKEFAQARDIIRRFAPKPKDKI
jgi:hypothetical protein